MKSNFPFQHLVASYEAWFDEYPYVFRSELAAIKKIWPVNGNLISLEIAAGTGRFAKELSIKECIDFSPNMAAVAEARGINTRLGFADDLPYQDSQFDVVLMTFCISYFKDPQKVLSEVFRVLKNGGCLILGFIDRESRIGKSYERKKSASLFYKEARFYTPAEVKARLIGTGFKTLEFSQTLFNDLEAVSEVEDSLPGYGTGSYVLVKTTK
jgi:ubiquinone/menaquinone biosynthesis C-methylase UbiE